MFTNVVVGVRDVDTAPDAIALARQLVARSGRLSLVHVEVVSDKPAPDSGAAWTAERRRRTLQRLGALSDRLSLDADAYSIEATSARRGLHDFAADHEADLLVVCSSHRDELGRDFVGDDARAMLQDPPCVVAVAPAGYAARPAPLRRIGVAYNGSLASRRAFELGRTLAAGTHAELSAFQAVSVPEMPSSADPDADIERHVASARERIAALGGVEAEARFGEGVAELERYGQTVDLLVIGGHRYTPQDRFLRQTTAQQLADRATSPLLVLAA